jgi:hypothetical protein
MIRRDWIDPRTGRPGCPACDGFGYHEDGTEEGELCGVCDGRGVARVEDAARWLAEAVRLSRPSDEALGTARMIAGWERSG